MGGGSSTICVKSYPWFVSSTVESIWVPSTMLFRSSSKYSSWAKYFSSVFDARDPGSSMSSFRTVSMGTRMQMQVIKSRQSPVSMVVVVLRSFFPFSDGAFLEDSFAPIAWYEKPVIFNGPCCSNIMRRTMSRSTPAPNHSTKCHGRVDEYRPSSHSSLTKLRSATAWKLYCAPLLSPKESPHAGKVLPYEKTLRRVPPNKSSVMSVLRSYHWRTGTISPNRNSLERLNQIVCLSSSRSYSISSKPAPMDGASMTQVWVAPASCMA